MTQSWSPYQSGAQPSAAKGDEIVTIVDVLRSVSILAVLAIHLSVAAFGGSMPATARSATNDRFWSMLSNNGSYGVTIFFVISGYLITRRIARSQGGLFRPDVLDFYRRRVARLLPLLTVVVLGGATAIHLASSSPALEFCFRGTDARMDAPFWVSILTFSFNWLRIVRDLSDSSPFFGLHWDVLWSLSIEEQFYLTYPWLLLWARTPRRLIIALGAVVLIGPLSRTVAFLLFPKSFLASFTNSFGAYDMIAMGALAYLGEEAFRRATPERPKWFGALGFLSLEILLWTYINAYVVRGDDRIWGPSLIGLSTACFIFLMKGSPISRSRLLYWCSLPGRWSYGAYLLHATTLYALWPVLSGMTIWPAFLVYTSVTFALAGLSFRYFEQPLNRAIRSVGRAERVAA